MNKPIRDEKLPKAFRRFPFYRQLDTMDCGPACLRMIAKCYGRQLPFQLEMTGRAYLISEDRRLLERFFEEVVNLVQNR